MAQKYVPERSHQRRWRELCSCALVTVRRPGWLETRGFMVQEEEVLKKEGRRDEQSSVTLRSTVGNVE